MKPLHQLRVRKGGVAITAQILSVLNPAIGAEVWLRLLWRDQDRGRLFLVETKPSAEPGVLRFQRNKLQYYSRSKGFTAIGTYEVMLYDGEAEYAGNRMLVVNLRRNFGVGRRQKKKGGRA